MPLTTGHKLLASAAHYVDHRWGWDRLPPVLGIPTLVGLRDRLRERNLVDTGEVVLDPPYDPRWRTARSPEGVYNDLSNPGMGARGGRFGRNVAESFTYPQPEPDIVSPSPREVSRRLLTRRTFIPARGANALVAAWLQFEVHDWFSHGRLTDVPPWTIPLAADDPWHENPMRIERTPVDPAYRASDGGSPTYLTEDSHWWDGSQVYGADAASVAARRGEDGTLRLDPADGLLPEDLEAAADLDGVAGNFWVGLALLHVLFTREHNAIAAMLRSKHPQLSDDQVFDTARLINAALMAKIHTVEWTPAVISHPTTQKAMNINWYGVVGPRASARVRGLSHLDLFRGIPGSHFDHHGVPYSLTEEFVAVYRMHPLVPDHYTFRSAADDSTLGQLTFRDLGVRDTRRLLNQFGMANTLYSFGRAHPGVVCLHNYPEFLQTLHRPAGDVLDLAAVDLMRNRERGVPRYNEFRRLLHMKVPRTFAELTPNLEWAAELEEVYEGKLDQVDMMVGSYAEALPRGFAFGDTAFRIFILMASRRLKSDRFFTDAYGPGLYTDEGLDWVARNSLVTVLLRHHPQLEPALRGVENGFAPWNATGGTAG